jgi:hypothetical protein
VARFKNAPSCRISLISLETGGYGLNLTAADNVILADPWWNPAVESQAIDRAHRIGQQKVVNVYRLAIRGTVEKRISNSKPRNAVSWKPSEWTRSDDGRFERDGSGGVNSARSDLPNIHIQTAPIPHRWTLH